MPFIVKNPCPRSWLPDIAAYETEHFGGEALPISRMARLWKRNPLIFSVLRHDTEFGGFFSVFPLNQRGKQILAGRSQIEKKIDVRFIQSPQGIRKASALYLEAMGTVGKGKSRRQNAAMLSYAMARYLALRFDLPKDAYAIAATEEGSRYLSSLGGIKCGKASAVSDEHDFYRIMVDRVWCERVMVRASKRSVPTCEFT